MVLDYIGETKWIPACAGMTALLLGSSKSESRFQNMIALLQRVTSASVTVEGETVGAIDTGLLVLVGVEPGDGEPQARRMCERLLGYRIFGDADGKMNLSLADAGGGVLLVPQFTLAADTRKGMRPSFTTAAAPEDGRRWFDRLVELARAR